REQILGLARLLVPSRQRRPAHQQTSAFAKSQPAHALTPRHQGFEPAVGMPPVNIFAAMVRKVKAALLVNSRTLDQPEPGRQCFNFHLLSSSLRSSNMDGRRMASPRLCRSAGLLGVLAAGCIEG